MGRVTVAAIGAALLAFGLGRRSTVGSASALVGGWLLYRVVSGRRGSSEPGAPADAVAVERTVTVGKSADELYESWRDPETLARVMGHFADVTATAEDRQRWTVDAPLGRSVEWESRIVADQPGEYLRWESLAGADLPNEGSVRFRPAAGDRGTEVTLRLHFDPPGGALVGATLNRLGIVPDALAGTALRRFKSLVETGEIPTLERNPSARGSGDLL